MKTRLSIRSIVLLSLLAFALLVAGAAALASRMVRVGSYRISQASILDDLTIIAGQISENLDRNSSDPFDFVDATYHLQDSAQWDFFYLLQDSSRVVLAPEEMAGKSIEFQEKRYYHTRTSKEQVFTGLVEGKPCYIVPYHFRNNSLQLLGIYQESYIFGDRRFAVSSFIKVLVLMLAVVFLVCWFLVLPYLRRLVIAREQAEDRLNRARELQQKAVTQVFPSDPRVDAYGVLQAMEEVGGDVYGCSLRGDRLDFSVGDVSGKGLAAALVMFLVSSFLHSRRKNETDVAELVKECNSLLVDNKDYDFFCTLLLGSVDLNTLEMTYCNAGHMRMLVNGEYLDQPSQIVAGAYESYPYTSEKVILPKGSRVILYTDGVTDTRGADGEFFGTAGLQAWASALDPSLSSKEVCSLLLEHLAAFRGDMPQNDDVAILCIKIL